MENFGKMYLPKECKLVDADAAREVMQALEVLQRKWRGTPDVPMDSTPESCKALLDTVFWLDDQLRTDKDLVLSLVQRWGEDTALKNKMYCADRDEQRTTICAFFGDLKVLEQVLFPETIVAADEDERRCKKGAALRKRCGFELLPPPPPVVVDLTATTTESAAASSSASQKPDPADSSSDYSTDPDADDLSEFEEEDIQLWKEAIRSLSQKKAKRLADLKDDAEFCEYLTFDIEDLNDLSGDWGTMKQSLRELRKLDQGFVQEIYLESEKIRETRSGSAAGSKHGTKRKR